MTARQRAEITAYLAKNVFSKKHFLNTSIDIYIVVFNDHATAAQLHDFFYLPGIDTVKIFEIISCRKARHTCTLAISYNIFKGLPQSAGASFRYPGKMPVFLFDCSTQQKKPRTIRRFFPYNWYIYVKVLYRLLQKSRNHSKHSGRPIPAACRPSLSSVALVGIPPAVHPLAR